MDLSESENNSKVCEFKSVCLLFWIELPVFDNWIAFDYTVD